MIKYLLRRLLLTIPVLLGVVLVTFLLAHAIPGSPWDRTSGKKILTRIMIDRYGVEALDRAYGLDLPLWRQFVRYIFIDLNDEGELHCGLICGNMGPSLRQLGRSVESVLFEPPENMTFWQSRVGYSLRLVCASLAIAIFLGLSIGMLAAAHRDSFLDRVLSLGSAFGMGVPNFVIGLLLIMVFATGLKLLPVRADWTQPSAWVLPALVLALSPACSLARVTRGAMLEVIHQDYVRTARAKGVWERQIITIHILRNALIPVVTMLGPLLAELLAGSFVIEVMFSFPGFGREYWESIANRDYSMIMGITLLYGVLISLANLGVDLLYGVLDPRLQTES